MTAPAEPSVPRPPAVLQPCSEACTAFRQLNPDRWSEFGLCLNPLSPRRGYPAKVGRDCAYYRTTPLPDVTRAS